MTSGGPTQTAMSVTRAAGRPPIRTVGAQGRNGPPTCEWAACRGHHGQTCMSIFCGWHSIFLLLRFRLGPPTVGFDGDVQRWATKFWNFTGAFSGSVATAGRDHGAGDALAVRNSPGERGGLGRRQAAAAEESREAGASGRSAQARHVGRRLWPRGAVAAGLRNHRSVASRAARKGGAGFSPAAPPAHIQAHQNASAPGRACARKAHRIGVELFSTSWPRSRPDATSGAPAPWPGSPAAANRADASFCEAACGAPLMSSS